MEGVVAVVFLRGVLDAVDGVFPVADAVGVASRDGVVDGMAWVDGWKRASCQSRSSDQVAAASSPKVLWGAKEFRLFLV